MEKLSGQSRVLEGSRLTPKVVMRGPSAIATSLLASLPLNVAFSPLISHHHARMTSVASRISMMGESDDWRISAMEQQLQSLEVEALEEAAAELTAEIAARKAAEARVHKSLLSLVLYVCIIGSAVSALPMTPLLGISHEFLTLVEAYGVEFELLRLHSWSFNTSRVFWQCTPQTLA